MLVVVQPITHNECLNDTTVFNNPSSNSESLNSLLTEDLSEDDPVHSKPTSWYFLSEDESNTNFHDVRSQNSNTSSDGANLNQLFPLTCAIPDLSTITETSKESDTRRFVLESDLDTIRNSPSLLD